MTFFILKDREGNTQMIKIDGALPYVQKLLKEYNVWLKEAITRTRFSTETEARAAKGGTKGFIWYLILIDECPVQTFTHEYVETLSIPSGKSTSVTNNPSIA